MSQKTAALLSFALLAASAASAADGPRTIRWLVAHPGVGSPFHGLMEGFAARLEKESAGRLKIEYVPIAAPDSKWGEIGRDSVLKGEADMSQLASGSLAPDSDAGALDLPFLFRSYEHAEAFFESPAGERLLAGVGPATDGRIRAFAFTYSGGFRVLAGRTPVRKVADFKGLRMSAARGGPVMAALQKELGVKPVAGGKTDEDFAAGRIDLDETEINRYAIARKDRYEAFKDLTVLDLTNHRMYTTAIIVNEAFYAGLTEDLRGLLKREVEQLARDERVFSIKLERENLARLKKEGVQVYEMKPGERRLFEKAGEAVTRRFPAFAPLVAEIRALKDRPIKGLAAR